MNKLKKFWIVFLSFLPFGSAAVAPLLVGIVAGAGVVTGYSIYRSMSPVDVADAFKFFSSCWSCQMFADIMSILSSTLSRAYSALGRIIVPVAVALTLVWVAWQIIKSFSEEAGINAWSFSDTLVTHIVKLAVVSVVLLAPFPRMITDVVIEPVFNAGLYLNRSVTGDEEFNSCLIATAMADPVTASSQASAQGTFSPKLRHNLACQVANVHQMTGIGMTVGWTLMNMAFNDNYMHKILWDIPIFPNVPMLFGGLLITLLFFAALLPVPLYFLEVFVKLGIDLVLLPLTFLGWLFKGWNIFPQGSQNRNIRAIVDDVISATAGITVTGLFVSFAIMFLDAIFGRLGGTSRLFKALKDGDSEMLIDGLMMQNDSVVTVVIMGVFIAMFMTAIPALAKSLFNVSISTKYYDNLKNDLKVTWGNMKKFWADIHK